MRKRVFVTMPNGRVKYEFAKEKKTKVETAMAEPAETATMPKPAYKHVGGGWYELEDGSKVRKSEIEAGD
jgi:hypothetical protein